MLFPVLVIVGLFLLFEYTNKPEKIDVAALLLSATSTSSGLALAKTDSDSDGLQDWEEALWKTDPHNPDSDGDGTKDGEEVKTGRDPAKKGPDDKVESYSNFSESVDSSNQTSAFTLKFLTEYATLAQSGKLTEENKTKLLNDLIKETKGGISDVRTYTEADIHVENDESPEAIKKYGNDMGRIIASDAPRKIPNESAPSELIYLKRAVQTKSEQDAAQLDGIVAGYRKMINKMLAVPAPKSAKRVHLSVVNSFEKLAHTIEALRKAITDPLQALQGLGLYETDRKELSAAFTSVKSYFASKEITFSDTEEGYVYVHIGR